MDYGTSTTSESLGEAQNEVERDRLIKFKLGIPLMIRDDQMFGIQLKYYQQRFVFDLDENPTDYDLYLRLNSSKYISTGLRFFYQRDLRNGHELKLVGGAELKSDNFTWNRHTSKYFISGIYNWKKSSTTTMGAGFVLNRVMGLTTFYPILNLQHALNHKWTLDLMLPKSVAMRYRMNDHNYLIFNTQLAGWRYNITHRLIGVDHGNLMLRKADLQFKISWEREIHDWLWLGIGVGYNKNLIYYLANPGDRARNALIDINSRDALFTKFSIFMVPPRKFFK